MTNTSGALRREDSGGPGAGARLAERSPRWKTRWGAGAIALALVLLPALAGAQSSPAVDEARRHADAGQAALAANDYARALDEYQQAYRLFPNALLLVNVARAESGLGHDAEAIATLRRVLADPDVDAARKREVETEVQRLRGLVAEITVAVTPEGAHVRVNGHDLEDTSEPVLVDPGPVEVEATLDGHEPGRWQGRVVAGGTRAVALALQPAGAPTAGGGADGDAHAEGDGDHHDDVVTPPPSAGAGDRSHTLMWVSGVGAGVLGVAALSLGGYLASVDGACKREIAGDCITPNASSLTALGVVADVLGGIAIVGAVVFVLELTSSGDAGQAAETALAEPGILRF